MSARDTHRHPSALEHLRQRLAGRTGRDYWRSLEELSGTAEFEEFLHREFPENASEWHDSAGRDRRDFLKLMGASLALAGLSACTRQPVEKIVPYVRPPEEFVPGQPLCYATALTLGGLATGVLVESHMGRPTKIEGNEKHPASLGATDAFSQAAILTLYDPDRSQVVVNSGRISTWSEFLAVATRAMQSLKAKRGAGLRLLTETVTSPTLAWQIQNLLKDYPEATWHQWEPVNRDAARAGALLAFGADVAVQYRIAKANVILSLESDFLTRGPAHLRHAREFAARRRVLDGSGSMNRLYVAESTPSNTGATADHRLRIRSAEVEALALALARRLGISGSSAQPAIEQKHAKWLDAVAEDLQRNRGASLVIPGEGQSPAVHALAHAMNAALGNAGVTVIYTEPVEAAPVDQTASLKALVTDMSLGRVEMLVMLGGNPLYNSPADFEFEKHFLRVPLRIHLSLYEDETSYLSHWHVPEAHPLEAWGDACAFDGTRTIQQPLIAPLYGGKSAHELLLLLAGQTGRSGFDVLRDYWRGQWKGANFESAWRLAVHDGVVPGTALPARTMTMRKDFASALAQFKPEAPQDLEIVYRPDPTVYDGRFANNAWLQELPKPLTKVTWENVALMSPATAKRLQLETQDIVELRYDGRTLRAPVWVMPGQADDSVTLFLGYGRRRSGRVGTGVGYNAHVLRRSNAPWFCSGLQASATGSRQRLATTQHHNLLEGRNHVRAGTLAEFKKNPEFVRELGEEPPRELSLYPEVHYAGYAWGMAIDLGACTGCNACVVACQAENNIPVVGHAQVLNAREMHWLRIDRYFAGPAEEPEVLHQPMLCQHCENAPCEVVCPVAATVHSDEGLNDMIYNRCVGTRYCSNNCPYKVRRFNFLQYTDEETPVLKLLRNPDVTVRTRGVMEKCTFCVQRINEKRILAEREGRAIKDGEIVTACQQACPAEAIVFGDINDPNSRVSQWRRSKRNYRVLAELNTRPRITYLARLRNPNPELEAE
jgi:molybdopterin-containing oxidoreductase family iron-sulfur binding subunit